MGRNTGPDKNTVMVVLERDRDRCVLCRWHTREGRRGVDWDVHHRRPRGMGGTRRPDTNSPANLITLCKSCHRDVESHRADSLMHGWLLHQVDTPSERPILLDHLSRWAYLTDDGQISDEESKGAADVV